MCNNYQKQPNDIGGQRVRALFDLPSLPPKASNLSAAVENKQDGEKG